MSTAALLENRQELGLGKSGSEQPSTQTIDVTISGAPSAAKGTNGNYSLHLTPLHGQTIPYYQGIDGDLFQIYIIYNENEKRWEIQGNMVTKSETKYGVVAYIACNPADAKKDYLASVSGKKEWFIKNSAPGKADYSDPNMVATVIAGGQSTAAPAASSTAAVAPASPASPAASTTVVSTPASPPIVVTAPAIHEMKTIITDIVAQYNKVSGEYAKLTKASPDTDWSNFKTNNLDAATADLKKALAQLDAFKKAGSDSSVSTSPTPSRVGGSSSSSKKNRKSHKSYHPGIGKTRKHHHSHSEPKRVSFVHQA